MEHQTFIKWLQAGEVSISQLLVKHYKAIGLDDQDFITILLIKSFKDRGIDFPDTAEIAKSQHISNDEAFRRIHQLIQKKVLSIYTIANAEGKNQDQFDFTLLYDKLFHYLAKEESIVEKEDHTLKVKDLYQSFEKEFGRPLSPMEFETISLWIDEDKYSLELIQMALREAVLNQAYSLKYIDRILLNWQKKNIKTKQDVINQSQHFRKAKGQEDQSHTKSVDPKVSDTPTKKKRQVPLTDWLADFKDQEDGN